MNERKFYYKMLLVDDRKKDIANRAEALEKFGVKVTLCESVDDVLKNIFVISDINMASMRDFRAHDFDFVLLDFILYPGEGQDKEHQLKYGDHPLGGLTLYPIFANKENFKGLGQCVLANYSDILGRIPRLTTFRRLTEIGHSIQHGKDLEILQTGFLDIDLVPLVKERCRSILKCCRRSVFYEIKQAYDNAKGNLISLLDKQIIPALKEIFGFDMTLGMLRPDVGREIFKKNASSDLTERDISKHEELDLLRWLNEMRVESSFCYVLQEIWHSKTVYPIGHSIDWSTNKKFWKHNIKEERGNYYINVIPLKGGKPVKQMVPMRLAENLLGLSWTSGIDRCTKLHRLFRFCLSDDPRNKKDGRERYDLGYFINDIQDNISIQLNKIYNNSAVETFYLYMPLDILLNFLKEFISHTSCEKLFVKVTNNNSFVEFLYNQQKEIMKIDIENIIKSNKWAFLSEIEDWGEFLIMDSDNDIWTSSPLGPVSVDPQTSNIARNGFSMRFPLLQ